MFTTNIFMNINSSSIEKDFQIAHLEKVASKKGDILCEWVKGFFSVAFMTSDCVHRRSNTKFSASERSRLSQGFESKDQ